MEKHVNTIVKSAHYQIHNISRIRQYLDKHTTAILVHAHVTSRLDNCNSLLYGIPKTLTRKLQLVQNAAARLITYTRKRDHIVPILKQLHWLPILRRIDFKILLIVYKSFHSLAPIYISELIDTEATHSRQLRSSSKNILTVPRTRLSTMGDCSFQHAAPMLWNRLPDHIKLSATVDIFKSRLKTHLFQLAYS
jgi:hypothetical protein